MADKNEYGLGVEEKKEWPTVPTKANIQPIYDLEPESKEHDLVLNYIIDRINMSAEEMSKLYSRWACSETRFQAYMQLGDYEKMLEDIANTGGPPIAVSITVPYTFSTIMTVVTYLTHVFTGRKPIFQVNSYDPSKTDGAQKMETVLQYQSDHTRLLKELYKFFLDGQTYGLQVLRTAWKTQYMQRTVISQRPGAISYGETKPGASSTVRTREDKLVYSGNEVHAQDPYLFFPDPRVPMTEVNRNGEFVFWRNFVGQHILRKMEAAGELKWVKEAGQEIPAGKFSGPHEESRRAWRAGGSGAPGYRDGRNDRTQPFVQFDQGTCEIIPAELGLGESEVPEKWLFAIGNEKQVLQAQPFESDHGMHPVVVAEPYSTGYSFGNLGLADIMNPLQDTISFLFNSHIWNVRAANHNRFIVDPSLIEMQDFNNPEPGQPIRLKKTAFGRDVRSAVTQLQYYDVTKSNIGDAEAVMSLGERISAVTDNLMGLQAPGGRKTATEVRTATEAAASRLASMARLISAQAMTDLAEQMCLNTQQYLTKPFFALIVGQGVAGEGIEIRPEELVGDFNYPIHDGTLPLDRVAMLDVWREILQTVLNDPTGRIGSEYDVAEIFAFIAELGGAKNLESMKIRTVPDGDIAQGVGNGQLVPLGGQGAPAGSQLGSKR